LRGSAGKEFVMEVIVESGRILDVKAENSSPDLF
jgi:hypothetical protein